jgi:hypothetical protein
VPIALHTTSRERSAGDGGGGSAGRLRKALREAKALLETGEVMRPDAPATTRPTPAGRVLCAVTRGHPPLTPAPHRTLSLPGYVYYLSQHSSRHSLVP